MKSFLSVGLFLRFSLIFRGCLDFVSGVCSVFIWVNPQMNSSISGDAFVCYQQCADLMVTSGGGTGDHTYLWSPALGLSSTTSDSIQACGLMVDQQYVVTVTDSLGCSARDSLQTQVLPLPPQANAGPDQSAAQNQPVQLSANAAGAAIGSWSSATATFSDPTNPNATASGFAPGTNALAWTIDGGRMTQLSLP